jgi:hypothetical protein
MILFCLHFAPGWQFLLMDSSFEGQSGAAIHIMEAGFTLIRVRFAHMPVAIQIAPGDFTASAFAEPASSSANRINRFLSSDWNFSLDGLASCI